jgi:hypothetical protein
MHNSVITTPRKRNIAVATLFSNISAIFYIVTCIARQQTDKHLATEYTHATIELRMLILVARQRPVNNAMTSRNSTGIRFLRSMPHWRHMQKE